MSETEPERGLSEAALHDKGWGPRLKDLAQALSEGEKSVLIAILERDEDAVAMTSRGSANDWFWAHLSRVGLMEPREDEVPEPLRALSIAYAVTKEGREKLPLLLPVVLQSVAKH